MSTKQRIILQYFRSGRSQRQIARDLHIARRTVKKYIEAYRASHDESRVKASSRELLVESIVEPPGYDTSTRGKRKLTSEIISRIDVFLLENDRKGHSGLHKQRMKKIDIYEALLTEGYQIGYTSVCNYIREKTNRSPEAYIRQSYLPGVVCEFDWGEVKLEIKGRLRCYYLAIFTSAYCNYRYAELFNRQDSTSFQQAHVSFFAHTGGVYQQLVYDNMRVAIRKFVGSTQKEPTEALLKLSTYYHFDYRFCNAGKGNEKGHVERSVEYIRRKAFCRQDKFDTLKDANQWLGSCCERLNTVFKDQIDEEKKHLYASPEPFDCCNIEQGRVDKYATITTGSNRYSVPDHLVGKLLTIKVYARQICCYWDKEQVCVHPRLFGKHEWAIKLEHYLSTLNKKPGALHSSLALKKSDAVIKEIYERHFEQTPRDFIELLGYMHDHDVTLKAVENAIDRLQRLGCRQVTTDKIITLCGQKNIQERVKTDCEIESRCKEQLEQLSRLIPNYQTLKSTR